MKRKLFMIVLPVGLCLAAYFILAKESSAATMNTKPPAPCNPTTSHTFNYLGGSGNCNRGVNLTWPAVPFATSYTVRIMYHGVSCPNIPSGTWITYANVQNSIYITMPRCFSLDLEIVTNCGTGPGAGTSAPYLSGYTFCFP